MDIRTYLCREAAAITDSSLRGITDAEDWQRVRAERLRIYHDCMGLAPYLEAPRTPLKIRTTGVVERETYRVEKLYYESLPRLYVSANLYVPAKLDGPAPAVAYFCGHSRTQKFHYQPHPRRWCELGFVALVVDTIDFGEIQGDHHGCYSEGRFHWYSRGYSPAAVECYNGIRALDLLAERPEVDAARMGITGSSGGGAMSWWLGAADERVRVVGASCGTGTLRSHVAARTVDGHCDCMFHINHDRWDLADVGALIAPRPLIVASADRDGIYKIESVRETVGKIARIYEMLGARDKIRLFEYPGPHGYNRESRQEIFAWFLKHLAGRDVPPEQIDDINPDDDEPEDVLRVYVSGLGPRPFPPDERVTTIDDDFIARPELKAVQTAAELKARREEVVRRLRELTFAHFPRPEADLDVEITQRTAGSETSSGWRFQYTGEPGWRLTATLRWGDSFAKPLGVLLVLRSPGEARWASEGFASNAGRQWAIGFVETRGVGDTAWGEDLKWHVRRAAAITGRTVASMRVYDTLRAIAAVRTFENVHPDRIAIAARGEMAPVALYAALLDGRIRAVILGDPPATQNEASQPDGRGPAIEMLSCLRVTDLAEVAGLLWPAELVFVGWRPQTYELAERTYRNLGPPGAVRRPHNLNAWTLRPEDLPTL